MDNDKLGFVESFKPLHSLEWAKEKKPKKSSRDKTESPEPVVVTSEDSEGANVRGEAENAEGEGEGARESADNAAAEPQAVVEDQN